MKRLLTLAILCAAFVLASTPDELAKKHIQEMTDDGSLTNVVNELVSSGTFCKVRGHKWELGCGVPGCLVMHYGEMRHCVICGAVQQRLPGDWK